MLKALAFLVLLVACFVAAARHLSGVAGPPPVMPTGTHLGVAFVLAFQAVLFTYNG